MRSRILFTVGGMAINARHRRDVEPAYRTGEDAESLAECSAPRVHGMCGLFGGCPKHFPSTYAKHFSRHRAEVAS